MALPKDKHRVSAWKEVEIKSIEHGYSWNTSM